MHSVRDITELAPGYTANNRMTTKLPRYDTNQGPPNNWKGGAVMIVGGLTALVRYIDVSYMIYFGLNRLANTKQLNLILVIVDDLLLGLSSLGLFYAVNFYKKRTAIPYALFGLTSIVIQIMGSHGPDFLPRDQYNTEIRMKMYTSGDVYGIYSDEGVELSRIIMKVMVLISQILFQVVVLAFICDRKWPL